MFSRYCAQCQEEFEVKETGRPRKFCSTACKFKWTYHNNKGYRDNQIVRQLENYYENKKEVNEKRYENMKDPTGVKKETVAPQIKRKVWEEPLDPEIKEKTDSPFKIWNPDIKKEDGEET
jgi:hypothetical protein